MVTWLPAPAACSLQLVDDLVGERQGGKNKDFFNGIAAEWRQRVQAYLDGRGSPANVPTWPAIDLDKKKFLNLYVSPGNGTAQKAVLTTLRDHRLTICPACGEAGRPNTLDHYLPKDVYPHFCVTPHNLFPMCDACQTEKGSKTGDADDPRFFLHPYYDLFIGEQVLELSIHAPFDAPTFDLSPVVGLTPARSALLARHVRELDIVGRYGRYFTEAYRRLLRLCDGMRSSGQNVRQGLRLFRDNAAMTGPNSWDHLFYSSVLSDPGLLDYLTHGELPPNL